MMWNGFVFTLRRGRYVKLYDLYWRDGRSISAMG